MLSCTHENRGRTHEFRKQRFCDECWKTLLASPYHDEWDMDPYKNYTFEDEIKLQESHVREDKAQATREMRQIKQLANGQESSTEKTSIIKGKKKATSCIDEYLFKGENTIKEVAALVSKELGTDPKKAYSQVYVRINTLKKEGYKYEKTPLGKVFLSK